MSAIQRRDLRHQEEGSSKRAVRGRAVLPNRMSEIKIKTDARARRFAETSRRIYRAWAALGNGERGL